jgi:putative selenium metabolism hydrolase
MNEILKRAKKLECDISKFLQDIVRIPSTSSKEGAVIQRIKTEMENIGFDEIKVDGLGNLMGRIGNGPRILALDGHCDVVNVGNPDLWQRDPFSGDIENGMLYGRGSCDQKGGLACAVYSAKISKEVGIPDDLSVWVIASIQEEDMEGMAWKYVVEENEFKPDAVLITEPTNLNIYRGHRGRMEIKVKTEGISCHGSAPERGDNAIYKMAPIINDIESLNSRLKDDPFLGKGTITITEIRSTSPSLCAVADSSTIHLDRRLTAGETIDSALDEIRCLPSVKEKEAKVWVNQYQVPSYTGKLYPMESYCPTWVLEETHPLLKSAVRSYQNLYHSDPKVEKWTFSTNGVGTMGRYDIPTFGFGPGNEVLAHAPNEYIPVEHLIKAMAFYAEFAKNFGL